jgi:2-polyprenyl-3-methyl-5-hydroxy-6-metoxy-1,4-benzoquinol methylase
MDHLEVNSKVTLKTLDINRTPDNLKAVMGRLNDVYEMTKEYLNEESLILDMGTKDGLFFDLLVEKGIDKNGLYGVDCCDEVVKICNDKGYETFKEDIQNTHFFNNSFDFIYIVHTLEHVPSPEEVVEECNRLLNENGYVFVEVPIQSQIDDPKLWGHFHPFTSKQQVRDLFKNYEILKEDSQRTKSKSPWFRILFQKKGE